MKKLLEAIAAYVAEDGATALTDEQATQLAETLRSSPITQPVFQTVFDLGHAAATKRNKGSETELQAQISEKEKEIAKLNGKLKKLEEDKPDVAALQNQHTEQVKKLEEQIDELKGARKQDRLTFHRKQAQKDLAAALVAQGVNAKWAKYLSEQDEVMDRVRVIEDGDDMHIEVLKKGSTTLPLQADDPITAFAEELGKDVEPEFKGSSVKPGTGSGDKKGATGGKGSSNAFDKAREAGKAATGPTVEAGAAAKRFGAVGGSSR